MSPEQSVIFDPNFENRKFEENCVETIRLLRQHAFAVLKKAGKVHQPEPLKTWQKFVFPLLGHRNNDAYTEFDSADNPKLALVTNAAAMGLVTSRLVISGPSELFELSAMEIRLSGRQTATGKFIDVMSIYLNQGSDSATTTEVIIWNPIPRRQVFCEVMNSDFGSVVVLTQSTLERINASLPEKR